MSGIKTLSVRMGVRRENTKKIVNFLSENETVKMVYYPGLKNHSNHEIAKKQSRGFGGMVSFDVGSAVKASKILTSVKYFTLVEMPWGSRKFNFRPKHAYFLASNFRKNVVLNLVLRMINSNFSWS